MRTKRRTARARERGFSLLEVVVAMAIFTIVVGAIYSLLAVGQSDAFSTEQKIETVQNARVALNAVGRDAVNAGAGYWKYGARVPDDTLERLLFLAADEDTDDDVLTPVVPGNGVRTINVDGDDVATDVVTFVYQDSDFNGGQALAVSNVDEGSGVVTVTPDNAPCRSGERFVYFLDDGTRQALGSLTAAPSSGSGSGRLYFEEGKDPLRLNRQGTASPLAALNETASCRRITWVSYFVNAEGTLVRREYGNTTTLVGDGVTGGGAGGVVPDDGDGDELGFVEMPLAFGVEDFQVRYVMADGAIVDDVEPTRDEDGTIAVDASVNRVKIRQVVVEVVLRGPQKDRATGQPTRVTLTGSFYTPNLVVEERPGGESV